MAEIYKVSELEMTTSSKKRKIVEETTSISSIKIDKINISEDLFYKDPSEIAISNLTDKDNCIN